MHDRLRKSRKQEKRVAQRRGETQHAGSGSGPIKRNDMHDDCYLTECKRTDNKRYLRIDVKEFDALRERAAKQGRIPKMEIEIDGREYVVLTYDDFDELDAYR